MAGSKRTLLLHVGWPKTGSTTLQLNAFPLLKNVRYLGKIPFSGGQNKPFFSLVYLLSYATEDWFVQQQDVLKEMLLEVERRKYGSTDPSAALLISDEGVLGTLFKPMNHDHHGMSVASVMQIAERLKKLEQLWDMDLQLLVVERDPVSFIHSYYAQLYYYFNRHKNLDTFGKYVDVGTSNDLMNDLGFANLKPGHVVSGLLKHLRKEQIHLIKMDNLFRLDRVFLHDWHPLLEDISVPIKRENVRSGGDGIKIANAGGGGNAILYAFSLMRIFLVRYFRILIKNPAGGHMSKKIALTESIRHRLETYVNGQNRE